MHTNRRGMLFGALLSCRISKEAYSDCAVFTRQMIHDFHSNADAFVLCFQEILGYQPPEEYLRVLTQYTGDFEQWWRGPRPNINEW